MECAQRALRRTPWGSLAGHGTLDVVRGVRQVRGQVDQLAVLVYVENIFNPHAQFFLRDVDARLESNTVPGPSGTS